MDSVIKENSNNVPTVISQFDVGQMMRKKDCRKDAILRWKKMIR